MAEQVLQSLLRLGFVLLAGFIFAYLLWCGWQVILWARDEIDIWKEARKR